MTDAVVHRVRFVVGSRPALAVPRRLVPVSWTLEQLVAGDGASLPDCPAGDGYLVRSAPVAAIARLRTSRPDWLMGGRQDYPRHFIRMDRGFDAYLSGFSGKTRSTLRRKARRMAEADGGALDLRCYRTPGELADFLRLARPLSERTYQARLLDAGLPQGEAAEREMLALAASDRVRAFLLFHAAAPVAYLYLPVEGETLVYAHLGHAPEAAHLSPGTVLQLAALEQLFAEARFRYFDFTEGDGTHKALFATDSVACASFLLLRPRLPNRLLLGSLAAFDSGVSAARSLAERTGGMAAARKLLRG